MPCFMYISLQGDDKILIFSMDPDNGKLEPRGDTEVTGGPAPLTLDPERRFLYVGLRDAIKLSSYTVNSGTGELSLIGTASLEADPVYIATDRSGRFLLSAYYYAGKAAVHPIGEDGVAYGPPVEWLSTAPGAHSFQTDPSNRFAFVPHIAGNYGLSGSNGRNAIFQYRFSESTGRLTPNSPPTLTPEGEAGPRHFCFHPSIDVVYFSNEQGCSVTAYNLDRSAGTLTPFQTISTLPDDFGGSNICSQIQITPSGRFLYAPNRGHNSIAGFSVDRSSGRLTSIGHAPTEAVPRAFGLDPGGNFLFAAGLESGRLASYRINGDTGALEPLEVRVIGNRPMWVLITELTG